MGMNFDSNHKTIKLVILTMMLFSCLLWAQPTHENSECLDCHDGKAVEKAYVHQPELKVFCVSCHKASDETFEEHLDDPESNLPGIPRGEAAYDVCSSCHGALATSHNTHAENGVGCMDCHVLHSETGFNAKFLKTETQKQLCYTCHKDVELAMNKPFTHPMAEGGLLCTSCHDLHSEGLETALREEAPDELVCFSCHTDKKGPFVFEHVTEFVGDCRTCHETHGSSNQAHLTRTRVAQLCLECHSTSTLNLLGPQPPSRHDLYTPRYQNCTVCHIAVHGSNRSHLLLK